VKKMVSPEDKKAAVAYLRRAQRSQRTPCLWADRSAALDTATSAQAAIRRRSEGGSGEAGGRAAALWVATSDGTMAAQRTESVAWASASDHKELRLQVPRRKRKRLPGRKPAETVITRPTQRWVWIL
jgi:cytosine/adenosine deaminase-related metal-dependent hydrolase